MPSRRVSGWLVVTLSTAGILFVVLSDFILPGGTPDRFGYLQWAALSGGLAGLLLGILILTDRVNASLLQSIWRGITVIPGKIHSMTRADFALMLGSLLITLLLCEFAVRFLGTTDADGQFFVGTLPIKPYHLPIQQTSVQIDNYLNSRASYVTYDPDLGRTNRPNGVSETGMYRANADGLRANRDFALTGDPDTIRIALLGDSFTHGSDVQFEESWGHLLEQNLRDRGLNVEVLNFGVGGYGMDQIYLRWQKDAVRYQPDIVLYGFIPYNVGRNLTIYRAFCHTETSLPFFKPRFMLSGPEDQLKLVNSPTVAPEEIVPTLQTFEDSPLAEYDYYFHVEDYRDRLWFKSRLIGLAATSLDNLSPEVNTCDDLKETPASYSLDGEPSRLALAIVRDFEIDVTAHDAKFFLLHMPTNPSLEKGKRGESVVYQELLTEFDNRYDVIDPSPAFLQERISRMIGKGLHFTPRGNEIFATYVADGIYSVVLEMSQNRP
jgi:hypothetical protein